MSSVRLNVATLEAVDFFTLVAFDNFHQPALGEEGPKFCEECSGQVGTNLEYKISNAIDQMLCSNERTPLYFSVITSTDALQSGFSIS